MDHFIKALPLALLCFSCTQNYTHLSEQKYNCEDLANLFVKTEFKCSRKMMVPDKILTFLTKKMPDKYVFAGYGQDYNTTDIPVYPNKRIIFNGIHEQENTGFVFYERGGVGTTRILLVYTVRGKTVYIAHFYEAGLSHADSVEDLKNAVALSQLRCSLKK